MRNTVTLASSLWFLDPYILAIGETAPSEYTESGMMVPHVYKILSAAVVVLSTD